MGELRFAIAVVVVGVVDCGARGRTARVVVALRAGETAFLAVLADDVLGDVAFLVAFSVAFLAAVVVREGVLAFVALPVAAAFVPRVAAFVAVAGDEAFFAVVRLAPALREERFVTATFFAVARLRAGFEATAADFDAFATVRLATNVVADNALLSFFDAFFDRGVGLDAFVATFLLAFAAFASDDFLDIAFFEAIVSSWMVWRIPANILAHGAL